MGLYATKQLNLGWSTAFGTFTRISRTPIWVGKSTHTAAEISAAFSEAIAIDHTINGVYQNTKDLVPHDYIGIPNTDPGKTFPFSRQTALIAQMRVFNPYGADFLYTYPQGNGCLCLVDDDGVGLYFGGRTQSPVGNQYGVFYSPSTGAFGLTAAGGYGSSIGIFNSEYDIYGNDWLHVYTLFLSSDDKLMQFSAGWTSYNRFTGASCGQLINYNIQYDVSAVVKAWLDGLPDAVEPDPYEEGVGPSGPGGYGDGTFDFSSTPIDFQGLPSIGAMDTGMICLYVPSAANLNSLASYLWAGAFDVDNFKKLVADPMDVIIGMHIVPLTAAQIGTAASTLVVGNIDTGVSMPKATAQYVLVDCGSISIPPKWGAYLDFSPYTKLSLFLPYIGYVDLTPDDCMNGTIAVKYSIDILGGTCVAQVKCNDHVLYELSGQCTCEVPITAGQYQNLALSALKLGGSLAAMAAGNILGGIEGAAQTVMDTIKPNVQRSGGFGGSAGLMGHQIPYLILTVPRMAIPGQQNKYIGYPSFVTKTLGDLSGYAELEITHMENMSCTAAEIAEIITLLGNGVIFGEVEE